MSKDPYAEPIVVIDGPKSESPSLARRTHDAIKRRITELVESKSNENALLREAVRMLDVLPLNPVDEEHWYGVRPDGDLLLFSVESPYEAHEETDPWRRAAELSKGTERFPELEALVPPPPLSCRTCPRCAGSGLVRSDGKEVTCICGGLGWLAPVEDEIARSTKEPPETAR